MSQRAVKQQLAAFLVAKEGKGGGLTKREKERRRDGDARRALGGALQGVFGGVSEFPSLLARVTLFCWAARVVLIREMTQGRRADGPRDGPPPTLAGLPAAPRPRRKRQERRVVRRAVTKDPVLIRRRALDANLRHVRRSDEADARLEDVFLASLAHRGAAAARPARGGRG